LRFTKRPFQSQAGETAGPRAELRLAPVPTSQSTLAKERSPRTAARRCTAMAWAVASVRALAASGLQAVQVALWMQLSSSQPRV